jgi:transcriptional regulator with XRE-family HTH domain
MAQELEQTSAIGAAHADTLFGWSQSDLATKLQLAGLDTSRSGVSKIEARLSYVDDKTLLYLAEVLRVQLQELFPARTPGNRIHEFMEKLETTRF